MPAGAFNLAPCVLTGLRPHRPCRSLWHGRVDRLLTALHGLSTEALLLHCQLVARSATRSLVEAGIVRVLVSSIASSAVPTETLVTAFATVTALIDAAGARATAAGMADAATFDCASMPGDAGMPTASGGVGNGASVKSVEGMSYRWGDQVPGYHEIDRPTTDVIKAEPGLSRRRAAG